MIPVKKPRVASIGLTAAQQESIVQLCGELRPADSLAQYLNSYSWIETDVVILRGQQRVRIPYGPHVLTVGTTLDWDYSPRLGVVGTRRLSTGIQNTERELFPQRDRAAPYQELANALCVHLERSQDPPPVLELNWEPDALDTALIRTTSCRIVAMRHVRSRGPGIVQDEDPAALVLALPTQADLATWFRAFLADVHKADPDRVPAEPPRMRSPSDWYTPRQKMLARQVAELNEELVRLRDKRDCLNSELAVEDVKADTGIRRVLWVDGDDLVQAVEEILGDLELAVRDMDAEAQPGEPKREDLRLTHPQHPNWEAIVEVKGYLKGTKANDALKIRKHRDRYTNEEGRLPDLTLWIANPYRSMDPSSRPAPDKNVVKDAANIGAVYALVTDLYLQWVLVKEGRLLASDVVAHLINADPGHWEPLAPTSEDSSRNQGPRNSAEE